MLIYDGETEVKNSFPKTVYRSEHLCFLTKLTKDLFSI